MDTLIEWSEEYSVNCSEIDEQHKVLFDLINQLYSKFSDTDKDTILDILNELYKYTDEHFRTEEVLFDIYKYPYTEEHKKEHKDFVDKVAEFTKKFEEGDEMLTFDILFFLKDWIIEHILYSDRKYIDYLCK